MADVGEPLYHGQVAGLVHLVPLFVTQDESAQRVVVPVGLERQEHGRVHGRLQQVAGLGDLGPEEQRLVRLSSDVLGNVLRGEGTLPAGVPLCLL